jgi:hypothetical protein
MSITIQKTNELVPFEYGIGMYDKVEYINNFDETDKIPNSTDVGLLNCTAGGYLAYQSNPYAVAGIRNFHYYGPLHIFQYGDKHVDMFGPNGLGSPNPMKAELTRANSFSNNNGFRLSGRQQTHANSAGHQKEISGTYTYWVKDSRVNIRIYNFFLFYRPGSQGVSFAATFNFNKINDDKFMLNGNEVISRKTNNPAAFYWVGGSHYYKRYYVSNHARGGIAMNIIQPITINPEFPHQCFINFSYMTTTLAGNHGIDAACYNNSNISLTL